MPWGQVPKNKQERTHAPALKGTNIQFEFSKQDAEERWGFINPSRYGYDNQRLNTEERILFL
jgi:hypothetical protein